MNYQVDKFLNDVIDSISGIEKDLNSIGFNDYRTDRRTVIKAKGTLESIFESFDQIPYSTKEQYPGIAWKKIDDLREHIIPRNFGWDESANWERTKVKITQLKSFLGK